MIKINKDDWNYLKAALITYSINHFENTALQHKVKEILRSIKG